MSDPQFMGSGELVTGTLRGYRSWGVRLWDDPPPDAPGFRIAPVDNGARYPEFTPFYAADAQVGARWHASQVPPRVPQRHAQFLATGRRYEWPGSELVASCAIRQPTNITIRFHVGGAVAESEVFGTAVRHDAPVANCSCGIYGWYTPQYTLIEHVGSLVGVTENSGRVLLGKVGFRAERTKIVAFAFNPVIREMSVAQWSYGDIQDRVDRRTIEAVQAAVPQARFYSSAPEMFTDYPPDEDTLSNLGIELERGIGHHRIGDLRFYLRHGGGRAGVAMADAYEAIKDAHDRQERLRLDLRRQHSWIDPSISWGPY